MPTMHFDETLVELKFVAKIYIKPMSCAKPMDKTKLKKLRTNMR
jgi:hypothetical protein